MNLVSVNCSFCGKTFKRPRGRYNEAVKKGWKQYCSKSCQRKSKITRVKRICGNPSCNRIVINRLNQFKKSLSGRIFCSRSCSISFNNRESPKRKAKTKICPICKGKFTGPKKYCSPSCLSASFGVSKLQVIGYIKRFYKKWGRLPLKREYRYYRRSRTLFGTWNNAVRTAGFKPNPVLFARKFTANDGHRCDSLSEKIVDDWLHARKIEHRINVSYPKDKLLTVDFLIKDYWVEFFGLAGQLRSYDRLKKRKLKIAKENNLKLIALYPEDLFPKCKIEEKLNVLLKAN